MQTRTRPVFATVRTEGAILPSDLLQLIADGERGLDGLRPEEDYHLAHGERLNEAINRSWNRLLGAWTAFRGQADRLSPGDASTTLTRERWLLPLFQELGYGRLPGARAVELDGKAYAVSHAWAAVPIHLVGFRVDLNTRTAGVAGAARTSPHGLVQELLNRSEERLWGFVSNGLKLRILRDNASLTRQAHVEFDLESMMNGEAYSDFVLLWLLCHQSRVEGERPDDCWLERWSKVAQERGTRALDQLRNGVKEAIERLGAGFISHPANRALKERLRLAELDKQEYYRQVLRLIYRLLFLFVAEDRELLLIPEATLQVRERYLRYYSTARLRELAGRRTGDRHADLYQALSLVLERLGREQGCPELGLPALGSFLFSTDSTRDIDGCIIANRDLLDAVRALAFMTDRGAWRAVDYRNLNVEEMGSVYESLLEMHPDLDIGAGTFELSIAAGNEQKTTGSYYTPDSLVLCLLDSALDPVLDEAAKQQDAEAAILNLKVCDPACGSGHFLIAAARRMAKRLASVRTGDEEPSPEALRHDLRRVIARCVYGVDVNPMAVELCKVALWMEALEPGRPLSFLDHRIRLGNSLLGVTPALLDAGVPDAAFEWIEGDDEEICSEFKKRNKEQRERKYQRRFDETVRNPWDRLGNLAFAVAGLDEMSDQSFSDERRKQERYEQLVRSNDYLFGQLLADAWCAAFMWKKTRQFDYPITELILREIEQNPFNLAPWMRDEIQRLAAQYRFFHWHLGFPDVLHVPGPEETAGNHLSGLSGGFDVVLGNPPWISLTGRFSAQQSDKRFTRFGIARYGSNTYMPNTYEMFVRLALETTRTLGFLAFLLPDRVAFNVHLQPLRQQLLQTTSVALMTFKVPFPDVTVDVMAFATRLSPPPSDHDIPVSEWGTKAIPHSQGSMFKAPACTFQYFTSPLTKQLIVQMDNNPSVRTLDQLCDTTSGFGGKSQLIRTERRSQTQIEVLKGESIKRFAVTHSFWFDFNRENITGRTTDRQKLAASPKILLRKTGDSLIATIDETGRFPEQSLYFLFNFRPGVEPRYILGLLNSRLLNYYFQKQCLTNPESIAQVKKIDLDAMPILIPTRTSEADSRDHDEITHAVDVLLSHGTDPEINPERLALYERAIDDAAYRLYQLTDEQIQAVEGEC